MKTFINISHLSPELQAQFAINSTEQRWDNSSIETAEDLIKYATLYAFSHPSEEVNYDFYINDKNTIDNFSHYMAENQYRLPSNLCLRLNYWDGTSTYQQTTPYRRGEIYPQILPSQNENLSFEPEVVVITLKEQIAALSFPPNIPIISDEVKRLLDEWKVSLAKMESEATDAVAQAKVHSYVEKTQNVISAIENLGQAENPEHLLTNLESSIKPLEEFVMLRPDTFTGINLANKLTSLAISLLLVGLGLAMIFQPWLAIPFVIVASAALLIFKILQVTDEALYGNGIPKDFISQKLAQFGWFKQFPEVKARHFADGTVSEIKSQAQLKEVPKLEPVYMHSDLSEAINFDEIKDGCNMLIDCKYKEAREFFEKAAARGHYESYLYLGWLYEKGGRGGKREIEKSEAFYKKAAAHINLFKQQAENKHPVSLYLLGQCYEKGCGVPKDLKKAVELYQEAANQKTKWSAFAENRLGYCYDHGLGVEKNVEEAIKHYQAAIQWGYVEAQFNLGDCYLGQKNIQDACSHFKRAADRGHALAQNNLGIFYQKGEGVEKDLEKAKNYLEKAASQGHGIAQSNLASCYMRGDGVEKNIEKAISLLKEAFDQGNQTAKRYLGEYYYDKADRYKRAGNLKEAFENYKEAAKYDHAEALFASGILSMRKATWYQNGHTPASFDFFKRAAILGHSTAIGYLGLHFYEIGDYNQAFLYFKKAAKLEDPLACKNLGTCYASGRGTKADSKKAIRFYEISANAGSMEGLNILANCYRTGYLVNKDIKKAKEYYEKSAALGSKIAKEKLEEIRSQEESTQSSCLPRFR